MSAMGIVKTGGCLCGAARFTAVLEKPEFGACHCGMCRKFSGGAFLAAETREMRFEDDSAVALYKSSDWAERGFCRSCGSSLFYRMTASGPAQGVHHFAVGALDDLDGLTMTSEIFIDRKPNAYAFSGERLRMTETEVMAMFAPGAST